MGSFGNTTLDEEETDAFKNIVSTHGGTEDMFLCFFEYKDYLVFVKRTTTLFEAKEHRGRMFVFTPAHKQAKNIVCVFCRNEVQETEKTAPLCEQNDSFCCEKCFDSLSGKKSTHAICCPCHPTGMDCFGFLKEEIKTLTEECVCRKDIHSVFERGYLSNQHGAVLYKKNTEVLFQNAEISDGLFLVLLKNIYLRISGVLCLFPGQNTSLPRPAYTQKCGMLFYGLFFEDIHLQRLEGIGNRRLS
ncbi:MAG: uncharacterized protein A8A55_0842 [Amphiamblys sp. WSBS2006]|nr:MAG: uncharacterized protein A8A55_0842 [Amphiamblys sp. WSBS2006]